MQTAERIVEPIKYLLLSFFVIMDGVALVRLFPTGDTKDQMTVLIAAIALTVVLFIEYSLLIARRRSNRNKKNSQPD